MTAKHLVMGDGNLGNDLAQVLEYGGFQYAQIPFDIVDSWRSNNFPSLKEYAVIWDCTGGKHTHVKKNSAKSHRHNLDLPRMIVDRAPTNARLVFFFSLDCAHPEYPTKPHMRTSAPLSEFAQQKLQMEGTLIAQNRPLSAFVRLGTLYGDSRPLQCLPGALLRFEWTEEALLSLPNNEVVPTPSAWAATNLLRAMDKNLWNASTVMVTS